MANDLIVGRTGRIKQHQAMEDLVTMLSSEFITRNPGDVEGDIPSVLEKLARLMMADCSYLIILGESQRPKVYQYDWYGEGFNLDSEARLDFSIKRYQWVVDEIKNNPNVDLASTDKKLDDSEEAKRLWQTIGIKSLVGTPLTVKNRLAGGFFFGRRRTRWKWTDEERRLARFMGNILANVMTRKWAEEAFSESEERYRSLFERIPIGFYRTSHDGKIHEANPAMIEMLGYPDRESLLAANSGDIFLNPGDRLVQHALLNQREVIRQYEIQMRRYDGKIIWVRDTARATRDPAGNVIFYEGSLEDITEAKRIEQALRNSEEKFHNVFDRSPYGILLLGLEGSIIDSNLEFLSMLGFAAKDDLAGRYIQEFLVKTDNDPAGEMFKKTLERGSLKNTACKISRKNGKEFYAEVSMSLVLNAAGEPSHFIAVINDVTLRQWAEDALQTTQKQLAQQVGELKSHAHEIETLTEMVNMLQICSDQDEAYAVVSKIGRQLFPGLSGALLILDKSQAKMSMQASWGDPSYKEGLSNREDCWALRRGRSYHFSSTHAGPVCTHVGARLPSGYLCTPIIAQGMAVGLLYLDTGTDLQTLDDSHQQLAAAVSEQIGLALSNLRLRDNLREQAIRDPLTGLYNRYYMEESLERELSRAKRSNKPVGVIMLDLDHFKELNTRFGHPNVDVMLQDFGKMLQSSIRSGDIACRYGGDEFLLILPEATLTTSCERAEQLCQQVKKLVVRSGDQVYDQMTISIGVACWPEHGNSTTDILHVVDNALMQAKISHDCVITA